MIKFLQKRKEYQTLINSVGFLLEEARKNAYHSINQILVKTYWEIGRRIVEFEQKENEKAEYGSKPFEKMAEDLKQKYGKCFSRSNIIYMRLFFFKYPKSQTVSDQLSWSHYVELLMIENDLERSFYEIRQSMTSELLLTQTDY